MLRITQHRCWKNLRLVVEGRLEGAHVIELENCWQPTASIGDAPVVVDLTGVTFIDGSGKQLLTRMHRQGVKLIASGIMTKQFVEKVVKDATR